MTRAGSARSNKNDDIPLARRSSPLRRPNKREAGLILLFSAGIATFLMVLSLALFPGFRRSLLFLSGQAVPTADGRLLGHYPYPEALRGDLIEVFQGLEIHKDTYRALKSMTSAASAAGVDLVLLSGYRSHDLQRQIFYGRKSARNQIAVERAKVSAPPGYSEHSTGYAIDLGDATMRHTDFEVEFENTKAFRWLKENAAKYHFVLSFPKGNPQKVSYEPWHWRFEGTAEALNEFEPARRFLEQKKS